MLTPLEDDHEALERFVRDFDSKTQPILDKFAEQLAAGTRLLLAMFDDDDSLA